MDITSRKKQFPEGNAIIYCQHAFGTTNGKTAHGLVRRCQRYKIIGVVDEEYAGADAGEVLDKRPNGILIYATLDEAIDAAQCTNVRATHLIVGLAPCGGRISESVRKDVKRAIELHLHIDCGLHDFLSEDEELAQLARKACVCIRDIRKSPQQEELHYFSGKIERVKAYKLAILGTDACVGKRTTAWLLLDALEARGICTEFVGTGQTAWLQGARYGIVLDSLVNDFVTGELEHAVWRAWQETRAHVIILEGQGSLMHPAFPGGLEILAATRPNAVVLQHAPERKEYEGASGYAIHLLEKQIEAVELISEKPVLAVTISHEGLLLSQVSSVCASIAKRIHRPVFDVLYNTADKLAELVISHMRINVL